MKRIVSTLVVLIPLFGAVSAQAKVVKAMRSCPRTPSSWTVAGSPAGIWAVTARNEPCWAALDIELNATADWGLYGLRWRQPADYGPPRTCRDLFGGSHAHGALACDRQYHGTDQFIVWLVGD